MSDSSVRIGDIVQLVSKSGSQDIFLVYDYQSGYCEQHKNPRLKLACLNRESEDGWDELEVLNNPFIYRKLA